MNENLNLVEILKDCPKGTKLYSTVYGEVKFDRTEDGKEYPVKYRNSEGAKLTVTAQGLLFSPLDGECTLFPSKEQRDWSKFKTKQPKFDPKTLKPFDKVLARDGGEECWRCGIFSHIIDSYFPYECVCYCYKYCIPYNEETKHLIGTADEAPEYYRYWED